MCRNLLLRQVKTNPLINPQIYKIVMDKVASIFRFNKVNNLIRNGNQNLTQFQENFLNLNVKL